MSNGAMMDTSAPQCEPSLEVAMQTVNNTRDSITDVETMIQRIEDFLQGARPEKSHEGIVEGVPSGIISQLCNQASSNRDRVQDIHRRLDRMAGNLGVQR